MLEMCDSMDQPNLDEDRKSVPPLCDCNDEESIKCRKNSINSLLC